MGLVVVVGLYCERLGYWQPFLAGGVMSLCAPIQAALSEDSGKDLGRLPRLAPIHLLF
jgi:hypothetical protein